MILQTVRHPKKHLNVWRVVAKRKMIFRVWFKVRLKAQVTGFQTHVQPFELDTWLRRYSVSSKIPPLISPHHGTEIRTRLKSLPRRNVFFCGICDDWASNSDMTTIFQILCLWTLKKFIFFMFMNFFGRYGTRNAKNPVFLTKNGEMFFFWGPSNFFGVFF